MNLPKEAKDLYSENYKTLMKEIIVVLIFISLIISDVEHFFMRHLYVFFGGMSILVFRPFFYWVFCFLILSYMCCLCILEINLLLVASFANIFSHSVGCLFTLFMISFAMQKLLSLIRSHLFIFVFIFITLGDGSKKDIAAVYVRMFCLCFPLGVL